MSLDQFLYATGLTLLVAAGALVVFNVIASTGDSSQVERSLQLVRADVRARLRAARGIIEEPSTLSEQLSRLAPIGRRITLQQSIKDLEMQILYAGSPRFWTLDNILALKALSVTVGGVIGLLLASWGNSFAFIVGLLVALVGYELPDLEIRRIAGERQKRIKHSLADTLDLLTVTVEAGLGFDAAIAQIARNTTGPLAMEFNRFLREKQIGMSTAAALDSMTGRTKAPELHSFSTALKQADKLGVSIGPVLRELTKEMRTRRRQEAQERAQKAPVKILFPLIFCIFPVLFVVIIGPAALTAMSAFGS